MPELEKRAWFDLAVACFTVFAWFTVFLTMHSVVVASASFALLALTALPELRRPRTFFDERDAQISQKAIALALRLLFVLCILAPVTAGMVRGWESEVTLSVGMIAQLSWIFWLLVLTLRSIATIVMYRAGHHA